MKAWKRQEIEVDGKINNPFAMSAGALLQFKLKVFKGKIRGGTSREYHVLDIDILVNKVLELHNSNLIRMYCLQDTRFQKVALVLKSWNRALTREKHDRLNSFSICMLLLAFMLHNRMMVNLQRLAPQEQTTEVDVIYDKEKSPLRQKVQT